MQVSVIGAGLAGCEAAWQLARRGIAVTLYEMKPAKRTPAHHSDDFAELCCSNSLRSDQLENAVGLLKEELRRCGSLIMACADAHRVEAGGALADVLTAKVQALLRRTYDFAPAEPVLSHRGAVLQPGDQSLLVNGEKLPLSKNEYRILWTLLKEKGKIVSRDALMARLWETDSFVDENTLSVNITRLRRKLAAVGAEDLIKTRKGMGYLIE